MKTLKGSILSRSSHGTKGFEAQRREMIEKWLKENDIEGYTIKDDFTIDVDKYVDISNKNLKELPNYIQFGVIKGSFSCVFNNLSSLRGCPRKVNGFFNCSFNKLTSLERAPREVDGGFYCFRNNLTSLEGAPEKVGGDFDCSNNYLTLLRGAPKEVRGYFDCSNNSILFTEEDVKVVCKVRRIVLNKAYL